MKRQELEGGSCLEQHPDHLRRLNLGQQSRRLHAKAVANSQKKMATHGQQALARGRKEEAACNCKEAAVCSWKEEACSWKEEACSWKEEACSWKEEVCSWKEEACSWKEGACSWKELDLEDEITSMEWAMVAHKDWAHGVRIQPGDVLLCVWCVQFC